MRTPALKSLDEHNRERQVPPPINLATGIACPECGRELHDVSATAVLLTIPPRKEVQCPECGYKGYRVQ